MTFQKIVRAAAGLGLLLTMAPMLHAQVTDVPLFFTNFYSQTGPNTTAYTFSGFAARVVETNPGDVGSATLTYPNGSVSYSPPSYSPTTFNYNDSASTPTGLLTAYPFGVYTTDYSGGAAGSGSVQADYTQTAYANDFPEFTASTYNSLQRLNSAQSTAISWNAFDPGTVAANSYVFFTIFNQSTGAAVFSENFLPDTTTSVSLAADTLSAGTTYTTDLIFSNRLHSTDADNFTSTLGFDQRTESSFTTAAVGAVPEASTTVSLGLLLTLGMGGLVVGARRKKAARLAIS